MVRGRRQLREKNAPKWEKFIRAYGVGETTARRRCTADLRGVPEAS